MMIGTTLTALTDQRFIKKIIAEFALFTWSCSSDLCRLMMSRMKIRRPSFVLVDIWTAECKNPRRSFQHSDFPVSEVKYHLPEYSGDNLLRWFGLGTWVMVPGSGWIWTKLSQLTTVTCSRGMQIMNDWEKTLFLSKACRYFFIFQKLTWGEESTVFLGLYLLLLPRKNRYWKVHLNRADVSRMIYVDIDSHNHVIFRYAHIGRHFDLGNISPTRVKNGVFASKWFKWTKKG